MWVVTNHTPYAAGRVWGRTKDGVHEWIVAVKAIFDIKPNGAVVLADEQQPPLLMPEWNGEDGVSSLRHDADLIAPKPTTDVIINGTAQAPRGRASADFLVSMRVDRLQKFLRVLGDRRWLKDASGLHASPAQPVQQVPIVYERAYGGWDKTDPDPKKQKMDPRNPVGCGVVAQRERLLGQPLHNFEYPNRSAERGGPAGFGAIASHWAPRLALQGTYDDKWNKQRKPLLPEDWDPKSLLCSPEDQRPQAHLHGGESVELTNLTAHGVLKFELPKVYLAFTTKFSVLRGQRSEEHRSRLVSVIIEPDHPRVSMVWLTSLLCRDGVDYLDETVVYEKAYV